MGNHISDLAKLARTIQAYEIPPEEEFNEDRKRLDELNKRIINDILDIIIFGHLKSGSNITEIYQKHFEAFMKQSKRIEEKVDVKLESELP